MFPCLRCPKTFDKVRELNTHKRWCPNRNLTTGEPEETTSSTKRPFPVVPHGRKFKKQRRKSQQGLDVEMKPDENKLISPDESVHQSAADEDSVPYTETCPDSPLAGPSASLPPLEPESPPAIFTRRGRKRKLPKAYRDFVPSNYHDITKMRDLAQLVAPLPAAMPPPSTMQPSPNDTLEASVAHHALENSTLDTSDTPHSSQHVSESNNFGLYRVYTKIPLHDPVDLTTNDSLTDCPTIATIPQTDRSSDSSLRNPLRAFGKKVADKISKWFAPFENETTYRLMFWNYNGSGMKSEGELQRLVDEVINSDDFDRSHLANFSVKAELQRLDNHAEDSGMFSAADGWKNGSVKIRIPKEGVQHASEEDAPEFEVHGIRYRSLIAVMKSAYEDPTQKQFHNIPFKLFHREDTHPNQQSSADPTQDERVWTDIYNSDALLEEQAKVDALPRNPNDSDTVEYAAVPIMEYSDATQLTNFGSAYLWPIYTWFGALSKYIRARPSKFSAHHIAYIPKLPQAIQDFYQKLYNVAATPEVLRFCRSQLLQKIWALLLDEEFMHAYQHGILVTCGDGIIRRLFPRIITYSADYPERVSLACIRFLARFPCPTCLVQKEKIALMGSKRDAINCRKPRVDDEHTQGTIARVREWIFQKGFHIGSAMISRMLESFSLLPTRSAFSERLAPFGVNFYSMFVPDILHEFEIGVFKAFFAHILRLIYCTGNSNLAILNSRFRQVPTFGRDIIRKFKNNVSSRTNFAARDYENVLKVLIVVVEGLLPPRLETVVMDLIWDCVFWHSLAKLRMQTGSTLDVMDIETTILGTSARRLAKESDSYDVRELPGEESARHRRREARLAKARSDGKTVPSDKQQETATASKGKGTESTESSRTKKKRLNLQTFKWHNLRHYVDAIRRFGPTDCYSTQMGELEHRRVKRFYGRTDRKMYMAQISRHVRRERILHSISEREAERKARIAQQDPQAFCTTAAGSRKRGRPRKDKLAFDFGDTDPLINMRFRDHHQMSDSEREYLDVTQWALKHKEDPAMKNFVTDLKNHLITRLVRKEYTGDEENYTQQERLQLTFDKNRIYRHKTLRINYTSYDLRRNQDCINPRTHADIMVLAHEDEGEQDKHPYWYARVLGIFHADVKYTGPGSTSEEFERVEFVWIRWFGRDLTAPGGFAARRLYRVGFVPDDDSSQPFGFLDPQFIIRSVHLIPAFCHGRTADLLVGPSIARQFRRTQEGADELDSEDTGDEDWCFYYVNIFVDRDMLMRYLGGGIGHKAFRHLVNIKEVLAILKARLQGRAGRTTEAEADVDEGLDSDEDEENPTMPSNPISDAGAQEIEGSNCESEEEDYGYVTDESDGGSQAGQDSVEDVRDDLGPDDGEDGGFDEYADLGFSCL